MVSLSMRWPSAKVTVSSMKKHYIIIFITIVTLRHLRKSFHDWRRMSECFLEVNMYQAKRQLNIIKMK